MNTDCNKIQAGKHTAGICQVTSPSSSLVGPTTQICFHFFGNAHWFCYLKLLLRAAVYSSTIAENINSKLRETLSSGNAFTSIFIFCVYYVATQQTVVSTTRQMFATHLPQLTAFFGSELVKFGPHLSTETDMLVCAKFLLYYDAPVPRLSFLLDFNKTDNV